MPQTLGYSSRNVAHLGLKRNLIIMPSRHLINTGESTQKNMAWSERVETAKYLGREGSLLPIINHQSNVKGEQTVYDIHVN